MAHNIKPEPSIDMNTQPTPSKGPKDEQEGEDNAELLSEVLDRLDKGRLPDLAAAVRQPSGASPNGQAPIIENPIYGSYHVLFPVLFPDGVRWLAKIPVNGTPRTWDAMSSRALNSEANTMRLLKRETTIPLPEVFDFSATTENGIGCPYILMSFISGKPLYDIWFGHRLGSPSAESGIAKLETPQSLSSKPRGSKNPYSLFHAFFATPRDPVTENRSTMSFFNYEDSETETFQHAMRISTERVSSLAHHPELMLL